MPTRKKNTELSYPVGQNALGALTHHNGIGLHVEMEGRGRKNFPQKLSL